MSDMGGDKAVDPRGPRVGENSSMRMQEVETRIVKRESKIQSLKKPKKDVWGKVLLDARNPEIMSRRRSAGRVRTSYLSIGSYRRWQSQDECPELRVWRTMLPFGS